MVNVHTDKLLDCDLQRTDPASRQGGRPTETIQQISDPNTWKGSNIWSNIHKVGSTPRQTDWLTAVKWLWLWLLIRGLEVNENNPQAAVLRLRLSYPVLVTYWFARMCVTYARAIGNDFLPSCSLYKPISLLAACFHAGFLLGLFSDSKDGDMFLLDVGWLSDC
jgi:hypothetical protein